MRNRGNRSRSTRRTECPFCATSVAAACLELGDRGVTPVDEPKTLLEEGGLAQAEIPHPIFLAETEMGEIGRFAIDPGCVAGLAELLEERRLEVPAGVQG